MITRLLKLIYWIPISIIGTILGLFSVVKILIKEKILSRKKTKITSSLISSAEGRERFARLMMENLKNERRQGTHKI